MTGYSREIKPPKTTKEGLLNFVQMIINDIERKQHQEALYRAVDLLDTLSGKANPYASITDGSPVQDAAIEALKTQHTQELESAVAKAKEEGFIEGLRAQQKHTANVLGLNLV